MRWVCLLNTQAADRLRQMICTQLRAQPVGRYIIAAGTKGKLGPAKQERLRKWNESCWKLTVFFSFVVTGVLVSIKEKWFTDTRCVHI